MRRLLTFCVRLFTLPLRLVWHKKRLITACVSMLVIFLVMSRVVSAQWAKARIYTQANVPDRPVAIVFGAWVTPGGRPSAMLADRVKMGAQLYADGKVKALLLTGDNHIETYNEPEVMRQYALSLGVPDSALVLDYAGFRTYDSCYRARDIFKVTEAILLTQAFHLDRALLTCNALGIDSVGVAVDGLRPNGYARSSLMWSEAREFVSTGFVLLDLATNNQPTYLGDPLPIFTDSDL